MKNKLILITLILVSTILIGCSSSGGGSNCGIGNRLYVYPTKREKGVDIVRIEYRANNNDTISIQLLDTGVTITKTLETTVCSKIYSGDAELDELDRCTTISSSTPIRKYIWDTSALDSSISGVHHIRYRRFIEGDTDTEESTICTIIILT